jgi:hypothetical protein
MLPESQEVVGWAVFDFFLGMFTCAVLFHTLYLIVYYIVPNSMVANVISLAIFYGSVVIYNRVTHVIDAVATKAKVLSSATEDVVAATEVLVHDTTALVQTFNSMAKRVQACVIPKEVYDALKGLLAVSVGTTLVYKVYGHLSCLPEPEGAKPFRERTENVWKNEDPTISPLPVSTASMSASYADVLNKMAKSIRKGIIRTKDGEKQFVLCPLGGYDYLTANHLIPEGEFELILSHIVPDKRGVVPKCRVSVSELNVSRNVIDDMAVVRLVGSPNVPDFTKFMPLKQTDAGTSAEGTLISVDPTFTVVEQVPFSNILVKPYEKYYNTFGFIKGARSSKVEYKMQRPGLCGCPIFLHSRTQYPVLLGIHVAGSSLTKYGYSSVVWQSQIQAMRDEIRISIPQGMPGGEIDLTAYGPNEVHVVPSLHHKNLGRFTEGTAEMFGELTYKSATPKHDVRKSMIYEEVVSTFGDCGYRPPDMKIGHGRHGYQNSYQVAFSQIVEDSPSLPISVVEKAAELFKKRIFLDDKVREELTACKPLTDLEAINGQDGVIYVDGIKKKAGGGFGAFTKKNAFLVEAGDSDHPDWVDFNPEVKEHIRIIEDKLKRQLAGPIFLAHMKNEPVKIKSGPEAVPCGECDYDCDNNHLKLPRVFTGTPMAWSHVVRKYFLPIIAVIQKNNRTFECAVGVDAESADWEEILDHVSHNKKLLKRLIAGDFEKYDKRLLAILITYVYYMMISMAKLSPHYTPEDIAIMESIAGDSTFPIVYIFNLLVRFFRSNPSGHPLTTIVNSLSNSLIIRVAWILAGNDPEEFDRFVFLMTYGDDNLLGVGDGCRFDHTIIQRVLADFNIVYTMADKSAGSVPFQILQDVDFLKRKFEFRDGRWFAPVSKNSIVRMLSYTYDTTLEERVHVVQVLKDAQRAAYQHGPDYYYEVQLFVQEMAIKYELDVGDYKSYEQRTAEMTEKYSYSTIRRI